MVDRFFAIAAEVRTVAQVIEILRVEKLTDEAKTPRCGRGISDPRWIKKRSSAQIGQIACK